MNGQTGRIYKLPHRDQVQIAKDASYAYGWILREALEREKVSTWLELLLALEKEGCPPAATESFVDWLDGNGAFLNSWLQIDPTVVATVLYEYGAIDTMTFSLAELDERKATEKTQLMRNYPFLRRVDRKKKIKWPVEKEIADLIPVPADRKLILHILHLSGLTSQGNINQSLFRAELETRGVTITKRENLSFAKSVLPELRSVRPSPPEITRPIPPIPRPPVAPPATLSHRPQGSQKPAQESDTRTQGANAPSEDPKAIELPSWWFEPAPVLRCSEVILAERRKCDDELTALCFDIHVLLLRAGREMATAEVARWLNLPRQRILTALKILEAVNILSRTGRARSTRWILP